MAHVHVRPHINNTDYFRNGREFRVGFFYSCFCVLISQIRKAYPQAGEKRNLLFSFCGLNMKCPHGLVGLHARSPAVDAIWGGYGTFNWWSSGGGITSLGAAFGALKPCPVPCPVSLSLSCVRIKHDRQPHLPVVMLSPPWAAGTGDLNPFSPARYLTTETESNWRILQNCSANLAFSFCGTVTVRSLFAFSTTRGFGVDAGSCRFFLLTLLRRVSDRSPLPGTIIRSIQRTG